MRIQEFLEINEVSIPVATDLWGNLFVPVKPICEAVGVNFGSQLDRIKNDGILKNEIQIIKAEGRDGKNYRMSVLPIRWVLGWVFTINEKRVAKQAREDVLKYKMKCYFAFLEMERPEYRL